MNPNYIRQNQGAFYDYSDPDGLNIKVSVWGYVKFPGRYIIPERSDLKDLISFAGGVSDDSYLDDLRIYRLNPDSSQTMLKFNYDDLWWNEELQKDIEIEKVQAGDLLVVPGRPRLYWENYLTLSLSIVGVLLSLTTLIITANN
jgi:protein involved in polysaccharide export with SLBB domain